MRVDKATSGLAAVYNVAVFYISYMKAISPLWRM